MLQLLSKTKAKCVNVTPQANKQGQKATLAGLSFRLEFVLSNTELDQVCPGMRQFLFTKPSTAPADLKARQQAIDGVEPVSDLPSLSIAGQRMGTFEWGEEQTGCTFLVDRGLGEKAKSNVKLEGCTAKKLQITAQEGGSWKGRLTVNTATTDELDDTTHGWLSKLKKREIWFTLEGPKVDTSQQQISDDADESQGGSVTPIKALAAAEKNTKREQREPAAAH